MKPFIKLAGLFFVLSGIAALSSCDPETKETEIAPPEKLTIVSVTDNSAELSWLGDAQTYEVVIGDAAAKTVEGHKFNATSLTAETTYTWKVRASKDGNYSKWVEGPGFTTDAAPDPNGYPVVISNIVDLPGGVVKIKALVEDHSTEEPVELASANYSDAAGATLYLPETIEDKCLMPMIGDGYVIPDEVEMSDPDLKFTPIAFMAFDSSDEFMGWIYFYDEDTDTDLIYADRPCTIMGTEQNEEYSNIWDISFATGYNWTQYIEIDETTETWTNGIPENGRWIYEEW